MQRKKPPVTAETTDDRIKAFILFVSSIDTGEEWAARESAKKLNDLLKPSTKYQFIEGAKAC